MGGGGSGLVGCLIYLLVLQLLQLVAFQVVEAAAITPTTTVIQTSKNTYTVRGANAEILKATIYNNQRREQQQPQQQQRKNSIHSSNIHSMPPPVVRLEDMPISDGKWQSLNPDVDFIPAEGVDPKLLQRFLEQEGGGEADESETSTATNAAMNSKLANIYKVESFAYGADEYDEYQQAWRLLGFIIDCNPMVDDDYYAGGSGDEGTEDGCARYVLWAAVRTKGNSLFCVSGENNPDENRRNKSIHPFRLPACLDGKCILLTLASPLVFTNFSFFLLIVRRSGIRRRWYWRVPILGPIQPTVGQIILRLQRHIPMCQDGLSLGKHPLFPARILQTQVVRRLDGTALQASRYLCMVRRRVRFYEGSSGSLATGMYRLLLHDRWWSGNLLRRQARTGW